MPPRGGSIPHTTLNFVVKAEQGGRAYDLHQLGGGASFRDIGTHLRVSATTAWRRYWWYTDWIALPHYYGLPFGPVPPQRGTRRIPRGRPCIPALDHPALRPPVADLCRAHRRDGAPCGNYPIRGAPTCRMHGSASPQVRRAAAGRLAEREAARARALAEHRRRCA